MPTAKLSLSGWTGQFEALEWTTKKKGVIQSHDEKGNVVYITFECADYFYYNEQLKDLSSIRYGEQLHFDAKPVESEYDFCAVIQREMYYYTYKIEFAAELVWNGSKPCVSDSKEDSSADSSSQNGKISNKSYDEDKGTEHSSSAEKKNPGEGSDSGRDDSTIALGYARNAYTGSVFVYLNSSTAIMTCHFNGQLQRIALERCRLYVDGQLCSSEKSLAKYIEDNDNKNVNFHGQQIEHPSGVTYRVITAWYGSMPRGDDIPTVAPIHKLRIPPHRKFI